MSMRNDGGGGGGVKLGDGNGARSLMENFKVDCLIFVCYSLSILRI